jgi:hypothetical protein
MHVGVPGCLQREAMAAALQSQGQGWTGFCSLVVERVALGDAICGTRIPVLLVPKTIRDFAESKDWPAEWRGSFEMKSAARRWSQRSPSGRRRAT